MDAIKRLKIVALIPPGFTLLVLLFFGFGEMIGGDFSGIGHLFPAVLLILLMWVGWKFPQWVGIGFIAVAVLFTISLAVNVVSAPGFENKVMNIFPLLVISLPLLASGALLLTAYRRDQQSI
jgi:hypothetical protein